MPYVSSLWNHALLSADHGAQEGRPPQGSAASCLFLQRVTWPRPISIEQGSVLHELHWEGSPSPGAMGLRMSFCNREGVTNWEQIIKPWILSTGLSWRGVQPTPRGRADLPGSGLPTTCLVATTGNVRTVGV